MQLPFFIASCDYTLIGEEFYAASAYLSGDPDQLGSLKGQDLGKLFVSFLLVIGSLLATGVVLAGRANRPAARSALSQATTYLTDTILK